MALYLNPFLHVNEPLKAAVHNMLQAPHKLLMTSTGMLLVLWGSVGMYRYF